MKKRRIGRTSPILWFVLIVILLIPQGFVFSATANGSTYYVSTTGSDSSAGTFSHPWKTIQKAANTVTQGDTVYIRGGTYHEKITLLNVHGTSTAWITFAPYNNENVIVSGSGLGTGYDGIFEFNDGCKYIRVTDLEIKNTNGHGFFLYGGEIDYIRIDHCTIHDCESSGIYCLSASQPAKYVRNVEFDDNTVYDVNNGYSYDDSHTWSPQEAISFSNVQGFEIHHNTLRQYGKEGIDLKSGSSDGSVHNNLINNSLSPPAFQWNYNHIGIYIDGYMTKNHDVSLYSNTITGHGGSGIVLDAEHPESGGNLEDISVYNNIIALSYLPDHISFRGLDSCYDSPWKDVSIYSNTIYNGESGNSPMRIYPSAAHITNVVIANNIVSGTAYTLLSFQQLRSTEASGRLSLKNNLYYRYGGTGHNQWKDGADMSWGTNYVLNDPKYINRNTNNFHLQASSPAIDAGSLSSAPPNDFEGIPRPQGTTADIGAYEYHQASNDTTPPTLTNIQFHTSPQLDTVIGWENITCNVTDNVAVDAVHLILVYAHQPPVTLSMHHKANTPLYYLNTSLHESGNYSYHIVADDTSGNNACSNNMIFLLPPNWDINSDGQYTILDYVYISGHYGQTGAPGWLREDVDNSGLIDLLDLTCYSCYYNECWWN